MTVRGHRQLTLTLIGLLAMATGAIAQQEIVSHPLELSFPELDFQPPNGVALRHALGAGTVAYVVEDHALPLVNISILIRNGEYTVPSMLKPAVANLAGSQMRAGGTASLSPAELDEELDFLAAQVATSIGSTSGRANMNCLVKDLDRCLDMFFEILRQPRYDQERLDLAKSQRLQQMSQRNDDTGGIEQREWKRLLYGDSHFSTHATTEAELNAITRDDLLVYHAYAVHPGNFIFAISGDVQTEEILDQIKARLSDWPTAEIAGSVPSPDVKPQPGLYLVHKEDVNQGRVSIGHLSSVIGNPDRFALQIMNNILGGGGFTSRILSRVRSDEGLAYSAGSVFELGTHYDGSFRAFFQSRSETVAHAARIVIDEINHMRTEKVSDEELTNAKASFIDTFSRNFASAGQIAGLFANLELQGRDIDLVSTYRDEMARVTASDVLRVAQEYLHPDQLVILAVGNIDDILAGDPDNVAFSLEAMASVGNITHIALPDPMTMEYVEH